MSNSQNNNSTNGKKFIFVSGPIGAGKSTTVEELAVLLGNDNPTVIKEYIDYDKEGDLRLNEYLRGDMECIDFQMYILKCYEEQFKTATGNVIIMERHPFEGLVFASQKLAHEELTILYHAMVHYCIAAEIPLPQHCTVRTYDTTRPNVAEMICQDLRWHNNIICHLSVPENEQVRRLLVRGRQSDIQYIGERNMEYLRKNNEIYRALEQCRYHMTPHYWTVFYRNKTDPLPFVENE